MACPGWVRDVTLLGGYCGHCEAAISRAVNEAIEGIDVAQPELLLEDDETPITAFTDGGDGA